MRLLLTYLLLIFSLFSFAQTNSKHVYVKGYHRSDGTYVQPHYRTSPNNTNTDNFSTQGNINPYTGQPGYISPDNKAKTYEQKVTTNHNKYEVIQENTNDVFSNKKRKYYTTGIYTTTGSYGQLWAGPMQKDAIHAIKKGTRVKVLNFENGFYKVVLNGIIGYIHVITINETFEMKNLWGENSKYLEKSPKLLRNNSSSKYLDNKKSQVEMKSLWEENSKSLKRSPELLVETQKSEYSENKKSKIEVLSEKYVSINIANLRSGPTTASKIITTIKMNYPIGILDESTYNNWTKVIMIRDTEEFIGFLSNSLISSNKISLKASNNKASNVLLQPKQIVNKFLVGLGKRDFRRAYSLSNNPDWNNSGGFKWFSSSDAYGGIDYIFIHKIWLEDIVNDQATVFADYYASDPLHISRRWKQLFTLELQNGNWRIIKTKFIK